MDTEIRLKTDKQAYRRYLRYVRSPYNIVYQLLAALGILIAAYGVYRFKLSQGERWLSLWYIPLVFVTIFLVVWLGVLRIIRGHHLDAHLMYKRDEMLILEADKMESGYRKMNSTGIYASQHFRYEDITGLTLLTDRYSRLPVLRVDLKAVLQTGTLVTEASALTHEAEVYEGQESRRYFPLYFDKPDILIDHLVRVTGLPLRQEQADIKKLREKRI